MQREPIDALERAALSGDWAAAARLGLRYLTGTDVPADPMRGIALIDILARTRRHKIRQGLIRLATAEWNYVGAAAGGSLLCFLRVRLCRRLFDGCSF